MTLTSQSIDKSNRTFLADWVDVFVSSFRDENAAELLRGGGATSTFSFWGVAQSTLCRTHFFEIAPGKRTVTRGDNHPDATATSLRLKVTQNETGLNNKLPVSQQSSLVVSKISVQRFC